MQPVHQQPLLRLQVSSYHNLYVKWVTHQTECSGRVARQRLVEEHSPNRQVLEAHSPLSPLPFNPRKQSHPQAGCWHPRYEASQIAVIFVLTVVLWLISRLVEMEVGEMETRM